MANDFMQMEEKLTTAASVRQSLTQAVNAATALTEVKNNLVAIKAVIVANVDGLYDAADLAKIDAKIATFKANVASLNTAIQAI